MELCQSDQSISISEIVNDIANVFSDMLKASIYEYGLNQGEIEKRVKEKKQLRSMLKRCTYGDINAKEYVKNNIIEIIQKRYSINKDNINELITFNCVEKMKVQDVFECLLYIYKVDYQEDALDKLIQDFNLDKEKYTKNGNVYYEINDEDIYSISNRINLTTLGFVDKLKIVAQRIYQMYKGNGAIDEIRDMRIDGVSAGVSGELDLANKNQYESSIKAYDSIWIFYHGKSIRLSFLGFGSEKELIRVCKNVYKYNNPGQLSQARGYVVNEMFDGSRVSVARPPFCENWVFFIRKFDSVKLKGIESLIVDENAALPIQLIWWLIKGCLVTGVTGQQGSGKTTLLMSMIDFIEPSYNLRIQEMSFELHLRKIYPTRNIVTFRETGSVTGQEGLDFAKKTDGTVNILGEVATAPVASWLIQMAGVGSLFTLFTHHAKTTKDLVISMRNALLTSGGFSNEKIATQQVCMALDFDIHMVKDKKGHRYIERITEIVNVDDFDNCDFSREKKIFHTKDIIRYENGRYVIAGALSQDVTDRITSVLSEDEKKEFLVFSQDLVMGEKNRIE